MPGVTNAFIKQQKYKGLQLSHNPIHREGRLTQQARNAQTLHIPEKGLSSGP